MKSTRRKTSPPLDGGEPTAEAAAAVESEEQNQDSATEQGDHPQPAAPPETEKEDEEAKQEEEDEEEEDEEEEEEEVEEMPKLEEGFYEIEDIRKKRVRKGQLQYLIKWRGWPETANTWEPSDNLQSCADIIEAFEERSARSSRKRRRKHGSGSGGGLPTVAKKRRSAWAPADDPSEQPSTEPKEDTDGEGGEREEEESKELADENKLIEPAEEELAKDAPQGADASPAENSGPVAAGSISIQLPGEHEEDGGSMDKAPSEGSSHFKGAKKRKSGSVRRFKQDPPPGNQDGSAAAVKGENGSCSRGYRPGNEDVDSTEDEAGDKVKPDDSADPPSITKIIMPVRYFASVTNNVQEVAITFKALRSDGKEVLVDDKHLKANNPLLLISYYEQHLRYSPHA